MLVLGTKESAMFNLVVTVIHVILVVFIIIVSAAGGDSMTITNMSARTLFGWHR